MYHVSAQGVDERMINVLFFFLFLFNIKLVPWSSSTYMYQTRFRPDLLQTGHTVVTVSDQLSHKGHGVRLAASECRTSSYTTVTVSDKGSTSDLIQDIPSVVLLFFLFFFPQVHH